MFKITFDTNDFVIYGGYVKSLKKSVLSVNIQKIM